MFGSPNPHLGDNGTGYGSGGNGGKDTGGGDGSPGFILVEW